MSGSTRTKQHLKLANGSHIAVIGGGPAGSFFSYFLLEMAQRMALDIDVDIYESKKFLCPGPDDCNMCAGVISESLVQILATEGINLPSSIVQRSIDSYIMHMEEGNVRIETPLREKRIATVHRGGVLRGSKHIKWPNFDRYLQELAVREGAKIIRERVVDVEWQNRRPQLRLRDGSSKIYDLLGVAVGVNSSTLKIFDQSELHYTAPKMTKTYISGFLLGHEMIQRYFGSSIHVFLLNIPRLKFAALIPKGEYITMCLLGRNVDEALVKAFLTHPEVRQCFPADWSIPEHHCQCYPRINVGGAGCPFDDRIVFIGDCGVSKFYKDGIGAAYMVAKAAANTAIFEGISAKDFRRRYWPICRFMSFDSKFGKAIFTLTSVVKTMKRAQQSILRLVSTEQREPGTRQRMSTLLWDVLTGSVPYRTIVLRSFHPILLSRLGWNFIAGMRFTKDVEHVEPDANAGHALGRSFSDKEIIIEDGNGGNNFYVIQAGQVEVFCKKAGQEVRLEVLGEGDVFGEGPCFECKNCTASVRALGETRVVTIDKETFLRGMHLDPSLAYHLLQTMARRIQDLKSELMRIEQNV